MKKINSDNKTFLAIIIGSLIIASTIYFVFSNTPEALISKKCKELAKKHGGGQIETQTMIISRCLAGKF